MPFLFQILFICLTDKIKLDFSKILVYNKLVPNEGAKLDSHHRGSKSFKKSLKNPLTTSPKCAILMMFPRGKQNKKRKR